MSRMMWHIETGAPKIFEDKEDHGPMYLPHHPEDTDKAAQGNVEQVHTPHPGESVVDPNPLTKAEVVAALDAGAIEYDGRQGVAALTAVLVAALKDVLGKTEVPFAEDESPRSLLAKVTQQEAA